MAKATTTYTPRLKAMYESELKAKLMTDLGLKNVNQLPKIEKVVVNVGLGKAKDDKKLLEVATNTVRKITGQQPSDRISRMSIASFKLREGSKIGTAVTLRGDRAYEFLDRVITIVLPRLRDFHGVSATAFDKQGNYSLGFKEQAVFPELTFEETTTLHGLQVNVVMKSQSAEHSKALLAAFGMPFEKSEKGSK